MAVVTFPQARIPLGWAVVQGQKVPVEIDMEWMLGLQALLTRTGGTSGASSFEQYLPMFFDPAPTDAAGAEAMRAVDELRNELASARSDAQMLRGMVEEQADALAGLRAVADLRAQVEELEARLAGLSITPDLTNRIQQIEDRMA